MSATLVRHNKDWRIIPMAIVDVHYEAIIEHLRATNSRIAQLKQDQWLVDRREVCTLDVPGMVPIKAEYAEFEIDSYEFRVRHVHVNDALFLLEEGDWERIPGCVRAAFFNHHLIMTHGLARKVMAKLEELSKSDEIFNAEAHWIADKQIIEDRANGHVIFMGTPRE